MPAKAPGPRRLLLARRLERVAEDADVQPGELGARIGRDRSSVYRIQTGQTLPRRALVLAYLEACAAGDATRAEVLELLEDAQTESRSWRSQARDGSVQHLVASRLSTARLVCDYSPVRVPGLLQTAAYARRLLEAIADGEDGVQVEPTVAGRIATQAVLRDPARVFRFVLGERAIARDFADPEMMNVQRDQLVELGALDRVQVLVLPDTAIVPEVPFTIYDQPEDDAEASVAIELPHADTAVVGEQVQVYRDLFAQIAGHAAPLS